LRIPWWIFGI